MDDEKKDPFVESLNKWKLRLEHLAFFIFLVLHLLLILLVSLSLLVQHAYKVTGDVKVSPEAEKPVEKSAR